MADPVRRRRLRSIDRRVQILIQERDNARRENTALRNENKRLRADIKMLTLPPPPAPYPIPKLPQPDLEHGRRRGVTTAPLPRGLIDPPLDQCRHCGGQLIRIGVPHKDGTTRWTCDNCPRITTHAGAKREASP